MENLESHKILEFIFQSWKVLYSNNYCQSRKVMES